MIIQPGGDGLLLFRQTDHALLSGAFATAWGNDRVPAPPRREQTLVAASRHDDGWAEWELSPKLRPDGEPIDFIRVPVSDHAPLYKRGVDLVAAEDSFAGLVVSLHFDRLYTRPFHPGMDPRIDHLQDESLALAQQHVAGERDRQRALLETLDGDADRDAEECWRLLQVWDRLSLLVCMNRIGRSVEQKLPPIASVDGDVQITARGTGDGRSGRRSVPVRRGTGRVRHPVRANDGHPLAGRDELSPRLPSGRARDAQLHVRSRVS